MDIAGTFQETVEQFLIEDPRYPLDAYFFVRDGFEYAVRRFQEEQASLGKNAKNTLSGAELSNGLKEFALDEFGPMAAFTLGEWNIFSTSDFGELVYNLIKMKLFSQNKGDKREDFDNLFDLQAELRRPYSDGQE